jgi:diguanylate cyclase (GGDEF)-like protein
LAYQADHDVLTGLANRRAFDDRLHDQRPEDVELSVIYLDLDRFKPINDTYGHSAGDAVLMAVADRLRRGVRCRDLVARLGGDEFAVLRVGLDPAGQRELADRLVAAIGEPIEVEGQHLTVGGSVGLASTADCTDASRSDQPRSRSGASPHRPGESDLASVFH